MNDYHSFFFQRQSEVLFVNEDTATVGVNVDNSNSELSLDVKDTIRTSNLIAKEVSTNAVMLFNPTNSSNYHNTLFMNTLKFEEPMPGSGIADGHKWFGNNFSNTNINWDIRLRRNAPFHHSWIQADPLSNLIWVSKWGDIGATAGGIAGGLTAAVSAGVIYMNPLSSPSGTKAFDAATAISGHTAGDDAIALGCSLGKEWGIYSGTIEAGKDASDAGRQAVEFSLNQGIDNEDSSLLGDTELDASGLGTAAGTAVILGTGGLPAWLGMGWYQKGLPFAQELGKLVGTAVGAADLAKKNSNVLYPVREDATYSSNKSVWASNAANYGSNTARWSSNKVDWASNNSDWNSNKVFWSSNNSDWNSNKVVWSSNKADWSSNKADWSSNKAEWSSNKADWNSNKVFWSSNTADWNSNKVFWSSNTATAASNRAFTDRFWTNNLSLLYTLSNVSIGKNTNASLKLDIDGAIHIGGETSVPYNLTQGQYINWNNGTASFINSKGVSGGDTLFQVYNGLGLEKTIMKLDGGGYVGINTTTPAYDLDVNGTINGYGLKENDVALITKYAQSNMMLSLSNSLLALSNALLSEKTRLDGVNSTQDGQISTAQSSATTANTAATAANTLATTAQSTALAAGVAAAAAQTTANTGLATATAAAAVGATNATAITGLIAGVAAAQGTADFASNALPNYATSNMLSTLNSNFVAFSNWSSNALSNQNNNFITLSNQFTAYSNSMRSNIITSNLTVQNNRIIVSPNGTTFIASNAGQNSNIQFSFINETSNGISYLFINPVHNGFGAGNPFTNMGVYSYSNGVDQGFGRLNLQGTVLYNSVRLEEQFAPSNQLSNYTLGTTFSTYSNFVNTQYAPSNQLGNYTLGTTFNTYSNFVNTQYAPSNQLGNYTLGTTFSTYSNFVNAQYARSNAQSNWNFASNVAVYSSNSLSNYTPNETFASLSNAYHTTSNSFADRYITFTNGFVYTMSNVSIGQSNGDSIFTIDGNENTLNGNGACMSIGNRFATNQNRWYWRVGGVHAGPARTHTPDGHLSLADKNGYRFFFSSNGRFSVGMCNPQYEIETNGSIGAGNIYEGGTLLSTKYPPSNHTHPDKYWTNSNSFVFTLSNARIANMFVGNFLHSGAFYGGMSHIDKATTSDYAFLQGGDGETFVNCSTGEAIRFRINNTDEMVMTSDGLKIEGRLEANSNIIINNSDDGLYLRTGTSNNYYWRLRHNYLASEETDGVGNFDFIRCKDGAEFTVAYIEDESITTSRLNFTASHRVVSENIHEKDDIGLIVIATGEYNSLLPIKATTQKDNITINEALPVVRLCNKRKDPSVFGVVAGEDETQDGRRIFKMGVFTSCVKKPEYDVAKRISVNALGEGAVWVCETNGHFKNGDFITTSPLNGYGERQDEPYVCNYTVAKITCNVNWNNPKLSETFQTRTIKGKLCAFVGCVYKL